MAPDNTARDRRTFLKLAGSAGAAGMAGLAGCTGGGGDGGDGGDGGGGGGGGGDDGGGTPTPMQTTTKAEQKEAIKVGQLFPLSGPIGGAGQEMNWGGKIVVEQINAEGGMNGHPVEVVTKDSKAVPDTAVKRARQLVQQENVDVIMGIVSSAVAKAVNQFTASQGVPLIVNAAQTPDITKKECSKTTFRPTTNIIHQQKTTAATIDEFVPDDATKVAGINPDYVYGHQSWEFFQEAFKQRRPDMEIVSEQFPAFQKGDYKKEIQATLSAEPDIVHSVLYSGDMIAFIKQANQFDFFDQGFDFYGGVTPVEIAQPLGDQMPSDIIAIAAGYFEWPDGYGTMPDRAKQFFEEYRNRFDEVATVLSIGHASGVDALRGAVEASGGIGKDDIISGLEGLEFESVGPPGKIRAGDHQAVLDAYFGGVIGDVDEVPFKGFTEMKAFGPDVFADEVECTF